MKQLIVDADDLMKQGRFTATLKFLQESDILKEHWEEVEILKARAFIELGQMKGAHHSCIQALSHIPSNINPIKLQLWSQFCYFFAANDWRPLLKLAKKILDDPSAETRIRASALDFQSRIAALRVSLGASPPTNRRNIIELMNHPIQIYLEEGQYQDLIRSKFIQAKFCCSEPLPEYEIAKKNFREIIETADHETDPLWKAEALLWLAMIHFREIHNSLKDEVEVEKCARQFEESIIHFNLGNHAFGSFKVHVEHGGLLLKYAYVEGVELTEKALNSEITDDSIILQQNACKNLEIWFTYHGDLKNSREYLTRGRALNKKMEFDFGLGLDRLSHADLLFRQAQLGASRELLSDRESARVQGWFSYSTKLMEAINTIAINREQAASRFSQIISELEELGPSQTLIEALAQAAILTQESDISSAVELLERASEYGEALKDDVTTAKMLVILAQVLADNRRRNHEPPFVTAEIRTHFEEAYKKLEKVNTLEGLAQFGSLFQARGMSEFSDKNWELCGKWLTKAEEHYRELGMLSQFSFTLVNQALVLIEIARLEGIEYYDFAYDKLVEAESYFSDSGMGDTLWRIFFYKGLCHFEAANRLDGNDSERINRWCKAEFHFKDSTDLIDRLRNVSTKDKGIDRQEIFVGFQTDKQLVYETAFQLSYYCLQDYKKAIKWLELMKSRAFLSEIADYEAPMALLETETIQKEIRIRNKLSETFDAEQATSLQNELEELYEELESQPETSNYSRIRRAKIVDWNTIKQLINRENAMLENRSLLIIEYAIISNRLFLFGIKEDIDQPFSKVISIDIRVLEDFINTHFRVTDGVRMMLEDIGDSDWLEFKSIISPVKDWSSPGDLVCIIPHGILHDLPLHTLKIDDQFLIERNPVFYAPSLTVLDVVLNQRESSNSIVENVSIFGNPTEDLNHAEVEANLIARKFNVKSILGSLITKEALTSSFQTSTLVHIAGHGHFSAESGMDSGILLKKSKHYCARDIYEIQNKAELVVLSCCETGLNQRLVGDELLGFVRALLLTGTSSLVVSQWRIQDESTKEILLHFYDTILKKPNVPLAVALQEAMLQFVENDEKSFSFYHWAPFVLIGSWR